MHLGKAAGDIGWHGRQDGVVELAERKLRVSKPLLRRGGKGRDAEAEIPAYAAMRTHSRVGKGMFEILMRGVSARNYMPVLPEMAETVKVSKSAVSREFIEASETAISTEPPRNLMHRMQRVLVANKSRTNAEARFGSPTPDSPPRSRYERIDTSPDIEWASTLSDKPLGVTKLDASGRWRRAARWVLGPGHATRIARRSSATTAS